MARSQNGWPALTSSADTRLRVLPHITGRVLAGDVWTIFYYLCQRYAATVEPITRAHSWGHAYRAVTNGRSLSNHASGTAVDLNAPKHPYGSKGTFTAAQVRAIRTILAELRGVVRWGGDYSVGDEMHFEIVGSASQVATVASRITGATLVGGPIVVLPPVLPGDPGPVSPTPTPTPDPISPTPTPDPSEEDTMAEARKIDRVIFQYGDSIYVANIKAGTYSRIPNPATVPDIKTVGERTGVLVREWKELGASSNVVANRHAFGVLIAGD